MAPVPNRHRTLDRALTIEQAGLLNGKDTVYPLSANFTKFPKPDMQTPSVIPKCHPMAKRTRSRWRRRAAGRTTLTAGASHIMEARGTLGVQVQKSISYRSLFHKFGISICLFGIMMSPSEM